MATRHALVKTTGGAGVRLSLLAKLHIALLMRAAARSEPATARQYSTEVADLLPAFGDEIARMIADRALYQAASSPAEFVESVLELLPAGAVKATRLHDRVWSGIHFAQAFEAYRLANGPRTRRHLIEAFKHHSSALGKRGAIPLLIRSFLSGRQPPPAAYSAPGGPVSEALLRQAAAAIGRPIDKAVPLQGGQSGRAVMRLDTGSRQYVLRTFREDSRTVQAHTAIVEAARAAGVPVAPVVACSADYPCVPGEPHWLIEEWMPGSWFTPATMSRARYMEALAALGRHMRQLHGIHTAGYGPVLSLRLGTRHATIGSWLDTRHPAIERACFMGLIATATFEQLDAADRLLRRPWPGAVVLCHGDLSAENILVSQGRISAVLDWESAVGAEPAYDFAVYLAAMTDYWQPGEEDAMFDALAAAYGIDQTGEFRQRVMAYRLLYVAGNLPWIVEKFGYGAWYQSWSSILQKPVV